MSEYIQLALLSALTNAPLELSQLDTRRSFAPCPCGRTGCDIPYSSQLATWQYELAGDLYPELRQPPQGDDPT